MFLTISLSAFLSIALLGTQKNQREPYQKPEENDNVEI
jgi:hypothetical protein